MYKKIIFFTLFSILSIFVANNFVFAENQGIVQCGNDLQHPCTYNDLTTTIGRVVNFALYDIALPLSIVLIIWGGIVILSSGGNESKVKKGKDIITSTFVGIAISFGAWLIVHTVIEVFFK